MRICCHYESPIGRMLLVGVDDGVLQELHLPGETTTFAIPKEWQEDPRCLSDALLQLKQYFAGTRREFDLDLAPQGTPFQQRVWQELRAIPFGSTASYGAIAQRIGNPKACRAVGMANSRNPIPIIIPCHRVIGKDGSLTGFSGGLDVKEQLLDLEHRVIAA